MKSVRNCVKNHKSRFEFLGVFLLGLVLLFITGRYYYRKEAHEEHVERDRRIAEEINRLKGSQAGDQNSGGH